jgi:hypothetical protein
MINSEFCSADGEERDNYVDEEVLDEGYEVLDNEFDKGDEMYGDVGDGSEVDEFDKGDEMDDDVGDGSEVDEFDKGDEMHDDRDNGENPLLEIPIDPIIF